jgi:hypothetical protein
MNVEVDCVGGSGFGCVPVLIDAGDSRPSAWFSVTLTGKSIPEVPEVIHIL